MELIKLIGFFLGVASGLIGLVTYFSYVSDYYRGNLSKTKAYLKR
jgi:hypothetical protein